MKTLAIFLTPALAVGVIAAAIAFNGANSVRPQSNPNANESAFSRPINGFNEACAAAITDYGDGSSVIIEAIEKLRANDAYTATVTGQTVARKGIIKYEQKISNTIVRRSGDYYMRAESSSLLLKMKHEALMRGGRIAYRDRGKIKTVDCSEYADKYGVLPDSAPDGHLISRDTITYARTERATDGLVCYFEVNGDSGNRALAKQMKELGGLKDIPVFTQNSRLTLTLRDDLTPLSLLTEEKYTVAYGILGSFDCVQSLVCTFDYSAAAIADEELLAAI